MERYDNLSKSVSDRNEKLQITLTRSMSVQDGLDEMMGWMERVEASVKERGKIPLDSASIGDILSKEAVRIPLIMSAVQCCQPLLALILYAPNKPLLLSVLYF